MSAAGDPGRGRPLLSDLRSHLTCVICAGYFVDATTIVECLHTFCRSCILRHLEVSSYCPVCDVMIHRTKGASSLRADHMLQTMVYKLVPGLFRAEMKQRRDFYDVKPYADPELPGWAKGDVDAYAPHVYTADENVHVRLTLFADGRVGDAVPEEDGDESPGADGDAPPARYLRCPAGTPLPVLQKLVRAKFQLPPSVQVQLIYGSYVLPDDITLMDLGYIHKLTQDAPVELSYRFVRRQKRPLPPPEPVPVEEPVAKRQRTVEAAPEPSPASPPESIPTPPPDTAGLKRPLVVLEQMFDADDDEPTSPKIVADIIASLDAAEAESGEARGPVEAVVVTAVTPALPGVTAVTPALPGAAESAAAGDGRPDASGAAEAASSAAGAGLEAATANGELACGEASQARPLSSSEEASQTRPASRSREASRARPVSPSNEGTQARPASRTDEASQVRPLPRSDEAARAGGVDDKAASEAASAGADSVGADGGETRPAPAADAGDPCKKRSEPRADPKAEPAETPARDKTPAGAAGDTPGPDKAAAAAASQVPTSNGHATESSDLSANKPAVPRASPPDPAVLPTARAPPLPERRESASARKAIASNANASAAVAERPVSGQAVAAAKTPTSDGDVNVANTAVAAASGSDAGAATGEVRALSASDGAARDKAPAKVVSVATVKAPAPARAESAAPRGGPATCRPPRAAGFEAPRLAVGAGLAFGRLQAAGEAVRGISAIGAASLAGAREGEVVIERVPNVFVQRPPAAGGPRAAAESATPGSPTKVDCSVQTMPSGPACKPGTAGSGAQRGGGAPSPRMVDTGTGTSDTAPSKSEVTATRSDTPTRSDVTPTKPDVACFTTDVTPTRSAATPTRSDATLTRPEVIQARPDATRVRTEVASTPATQGAAGGGAAQTPLPRKPSVGERLPRPSSTPASAPAVASASAAAPRRVSLGGAPPAPHKPAPAPPRTYHAGLLKVPSVSSSYSLNARLPSSTKSPKAKAPNAGRSDQDKRGITSYSLWKNMKALKTASERARPAGGSEPASKKPSGAAPAALPLDLSTHVRKAVAADSTSMLAKTPSPPPKAKRARPKSAKAQGTQTIHSIVSSLASRQHISLTPIASASGPSGKPAARAARVPTPRPPHLSSHLPMPMPFPMPDYSLASGGMFTPPLHVNTSMAGRIGYDMAMRNLLTLSHMAMAQGGMPRPPMFPMQPVFPARPKSQDFHQNPDPSLLRQQSEARMGAASKKASPTAGSTAPQLRTPTALTSASIQHMEDLTRTLGKKRPDKERHSVTVTAIPSKE